MWFSYSELCGTAFDAVDALRSAIPKGFNFKNIKRFSSLEIEKISFLFKIGNAQFRNDVLLNYWGRNGFDGDKEVQVAYQAPAGL
jgi:hypothetical protein